MSEDRVDQTFRIIAIFVLFACIAILTMKLRKELDRLFWPPDPVPTTTITTEGRPYTHTGSMWTASPSPNHDVTFYLPDTRNPINYLFGYDEKRGATPYRVTIRRRQDYIEVIGECNGKPTVVIWANTVEERQ